VTHALRVEVDPTRVRLSAIIRASVRRESLLVLTGHVFADLWDELGDYDAVMGFLRDVATAADRPVGIDVAHGDGPSATVFVAPPAWSGERLRDWIGETQAALEAMLGEATVREES
jgi:hypothetical protein